MKKICFVLLTIIMILSLCGCGSTSSDFVSYKNENLQRDAFVLSFGTSMPEDSYVADAMRIIKNTCENKTSNRVKINLYFSNELGDADITLQNLKNTTVNMGLYNTGDIFDYRLSLNSIPYLLETPEQIKYYYSPGSVFYKYYSSYFEPLGVKLLGIYADGYVGLAFSEYPMSYNNPQIPKFIMIRKGPSDVQSYVLDAMHFTSTAVPFDEISRAFYLNAVQGAFGLSAISADEVLGTTVKYWLPINPYLDTLDFIISLDTWNSLPDDYKTIIQDAVTEACNNQFSVIDAHNEEAIDFLTADGTTVLELTDEEYNTYKDQIQSYSWSKISSKVGDELFNEIVDDVKSH